MRMRMKGAGYGLATVALLMAAPFLGAGAAHAGDPAQCAAYATMAVQQQQKNKAMGCGFAGIRWQSNWGAHYAWCIGAPDWQIGNETQARHHDLQMCGAGAGTPGPAIKTFHNPTIGGVRLDWCRTWSHECGAAAAHAYCQQRGYVQATNWKEAPDIGTFTNTRVIGTGQICSGPTCDGFAWVTCSK